MELRALHGHAAAAHRWLRPRLADGAWVDEPDAIVDAYYKVPWWLAAVGDEEAAHQTLSYIERRFLRDDGDLVPVHSPKLRERYPLIPHAHIALGAGLVGRTELRDTLLDFLAGQQHSEWRGWGDRVDGSHPRRVDSISTACIGLAFLEAERPEAAREAAGFLEKLVDAQPAPATDLLTTVTDSSVMTDFPDDATRVDRRVTFSLRFQVWHAIGFPIMLLGRLYESNRDPRWLRLAEHFVGLFDVSPQAWIDLSAGKAAWGFAVLYRATGDRRHRQRALRALRGLVSWQDPDGGWLGCLDGAGGSGSSVTSIGYEIDTELTMWLSAVGRIIADEDDVTWDPGGPERSPLASVETTVSRWLARQQRLAPARRHRLARVVTRSGA